MPIQILRRGTRGAAVRRWQYFLIGRRHLKSPADGDFGPRTERATRAYQRSSAIAADGIVGPVTIGAALGDGFDIGFVDGGEPAGSAILTGAPTLRAATAATRKRLFGEFAFRPAPTSRNPEAIEVLGDWAAQNITMVTLPELKGIPVYNRRSSGRMRFHRKAAGQLEALWAAWGRAGLMDRVRTYEGSYIPRFVRGRPGRLSSHAYGSAFDINQRWNRLGHLPAPAGAEGSVRELVDIASAHGFFWGGHFKGRPDGMHFEVAKLL